MKSYLAMSINGFGYSMGIYVRQVFWTVDWANVLCEVVFSSYGWHVWSEIDVKNLTQQMSEHVHIENKSLLNIYIWNKKTTTKNERKPRV